MVCSALDMLAGISILRAALATAYTVDDAAPMKDGALPCVGRSCAWWTLRNQKRLARRLTPGALRRVKLAAVYLSMTLLCLIFGVLIVRSLLALVTWVALGRCLWLFPYLLSEVPPSPCSKKFRQVKRSIVSAAILCM